MNVLTWWKGSPTLEQVASDFRFGQVKSGPYPERLLSKVSFRDLSPDLVDGGTRYVVAINRATPREAERFHRDLMILLMGRYNLMAHNIQTYMAHSQDPEWLALEFAVGMTEAIKLLRVAPRDRNIAQARRILQQLLRRA